MRIVFMGTPEFAVASLDALVNSQYDVVGVVTVPDKQAGRGRKIRTSAVKDYAVDKNITLLQPEKLKNPEFIEALKALKADLFVVVAFRMLPKIVWSMPKNGTFNIHASLLPQYRGAAPINHAIINGEKETGLTTFMIDEEIDTGRIIQQKRIKILDDEDAGSLHDRLMELSKSIVVETCELIKGGNTKLISQKEFIKENIQLNEAPKIFKDNCRISPDLGVEKSELLARGLSPYPAAFVEIESPNGEIFSLKIFKVKTIREKSLQGKIFTDGKSSLALGFNDGKLLLEDIQLQNKKRMKITDFLRGFDISSDWKWK